MDELQSAKEALSMASTPAPTGSDRIDTALDALHRALLYLGSDARGRAELAVDMVEGKGEAEFVHRIFHCLRALSVPVRRELKRCDLVIWDVAFEVKLLHVHVALSSKRADRGFRDFVRSKDLAALRNGTADVLLAVVPHFHQVTHRKYPLQVGPSELERVRIDYEQLTGALTRAATDFAEEFGVVMARRVPFLLEDEIDGLVELTIFAFTRFPEGGVR